MNFMMIFKVALLAILRNKTRSLLTCLGIIVGIAAVIAAMAPALMKSLLPVSIQTPFNP
mgnify:CR=1 FL=1